GRLAGRLPRHRARLRGLSRRHPRRAVPPDPAGEGLSQLPRCRVVPDRRGVRSREDALSARRQASLARVRPLPPERGAAQRHDRGALAARLPAVQGLPRQPASRGRWALTARADRRSVKLAWATGLALAALALLAATAGSAPANPAPTGRAPVSLAMRPKAAHDGFVDDMDCSACHTSDG